MPELAETSETESGKDSGGSNNSESEPDRAGVPSNLAAFPSLPNSTLEKMGLLCKRGDIVIDTSFDIDGEGASSQTSEQLSEQEIEDNYQSLCLAFRTDKLTLDKRIDLHERARDISEQNVDNELGGLKEGLKALSPFCTDGHSREVYAKIQHHVEVLEQSATRVSSRAELHGAVQQELRLNKAVDVMVQHVENLKRLYEKEHNELEETRKLISENKPEEGSGSGLKRYSLAGVAGGKPLVRRRASVAAFPRRLSILGTSSGATSMSSSSSHVTAPIVPTSDSNSMDPRSRFQTIVADTALKNSVAGAFRRASVEKQKRQLESRRSSGTESISEEPSSEPSQTQESTSKHQNGSTSSVEDVKLSNEDQVFQKGFEEGVRAQIQQELGELRDQQKLFSDSLEDLMEENELDDDLHSLEREKPGERFLLKLKTLWPELNLTSQKLRLTVAGFVFFMALLSMFVTLLPVGFAAERQPHRVRWSLSLDDLVKHHIHLKHNGVPPQ